MRNPTQEFFAGLSRRGHERLFKEIEGSLRFSLEEDHHTNHWFVAIRKGEVHVSREEREADCVVHTSEASFDRMVTGEMNLQQAWLRNALLVEGNLELLRRFDRVLPAPPGAHHPRAVATVSKGSHEWGPDPYLGRQHVRGERDEWRHRCIAGLPDRSVLA